MPNLEDLGYDELLELAQKKRLVPDEATEWGAVGRYIERTANEEPVFETPEMSFKKLSRELLRLKGENEYLRSIVKRVQPEALEHLRGKRRSRGALDNLMVWEQRNKDIDGRR